jgi:hypothetical protein
MNETTAISRLNGGGMLISMATARHKRIIVDSGRMNHFGPVYRLKANLQATAAHKPMSAFEEGDCKSPVSVAACDVSENQFPVPLVG